MRLFTGIALPDDTIESLNACVRRLRPAAVIAWSPAENYHITTKFLGECPESDLPSIELALAAVPCPAPFPIAIEQLGFFPNLRSPRVLWAGVRASPELAALARGTDEALEPLGIVPESRPFSPHLTLARIRPGQNASGLASAVSQHPQPHFGTFTGREFHLYRSITSPRGSRYAKLRTFEFPQPSASRHDRGNALT